MKWILILSLIVGIIQFYRLVKRKEHEFEQILGTRFFEHKPIILDKSTRIIAQESHGYSQKSSLGCLILSSRELYFKSQLSEREIIIPSAALQEVSKTNRMLGKHPLRPMLKIDFHSSDGQKDAVALLVKDLARWKIEISRVIQIHSQA